MMAARALKYYITLVEIKHKGRPNHMKFSASNALRLRDWSGKTKRE